MPSPSARRYEKGRYHHRPALSSQCLPCCSPPMPWTSARAWKHRRCGWTRALGSRQRGQRTLCSVAVCASGSRFTPRRSHSGDTWAVVEGEGDCARTATKTGACEDRRTAPKNMTSNTNSAVSRAGSQVEAPMVRATDGLAWNGQTRLDETWF